MSKKQKKYIFIVSVFIFILLFNQNIYANNMIKGSFNITDETPNSGNYMVKLHFKNISNKTISFHSGLIRLYDKQGYTYTSKTQIIDGKFESYAFILPGECFTNNIEFQIDGNIKPDSISIPLEYSSNQYIDFTNSKITFNNSTHKTLDKNQELDNQSLKIKVDKITVDGNKIITTFLIKNTSSSPISFGLGGVALSTPYLKDKNGRYLEKENSMEKLPSEIRPNGILRIKNKFNINNTKPPYYLYIQHYDGFTSIKNKYVWKIIEEKE
ncbi:MAG: hypothetical protein ACOC1K_02635 [Nanoarchaeota archaeon]